MENNYTYWRLQEVGERKSEEEGKTADDASDTKYSTM